MKLFPLILNKTEKAILITLLVVSLLSNKKLEAQSNKLFAIDITTGRVYLDTLDLKSKVIHSLDTLRFKFDAFTSYDRTYDSRHGYYLIECDTAIIVISATGKLIKTIHKPDDVEGMAYDPKTDKIYCAIWKNTTFYFASLNIANSTFTLIRSLSDNSVHSSTMDYENRHYYIISDTRGLLKINLQTGVKLDSIKSFTTNNCRCNVFDYETNNIASTCVQNGQVVLQLYHTVKKTIRVLDTLGKYGTGFFSYESATFNQNTGDWYLNLGKKLGIKNIRTNTKMDTMYLPFNRIRSLVLNEATCYRPLTISGLFKQNPNCYNASDGQIKLNVSGGRKPFVYSLNNLNFDTISFFNNLKSGTYTINAKDKNEFCTLSLAVTMISPDPFGINATIKNNTCNKDSFGRIELNTKGATPPYAYSMKGNLFVSDSVYSKLTTGNYTFYVKDINNCLDTLENLQVYAPPVFSIDSLNLQHVVCFGEKNGEANFHFSGGIAPYLTSLDSSNFMTLQKMKGLLAGTYHLTAKDQNNCIIKSYFSISEPPAFYPSIFKRNPMCYGDETGIAKVNIAGGHPIEKYWFKINNEQKNYSIVDTIHSLNSGVYQIMLWNNNLCKDSLEFTITNPPEFKIKPTEDIILCNGQQIKLDKHNDRAKSYLLNSNTNLLFTTDTFTLSLAGTYYFKAKDSNNCMSKDTFTISKINMDVTHDFLIPSLAFLSDTVYAVNISRPLADNTEWQFNRPSQIQFSKDQNTLGFQFSDTGQYAITLQSRFKSCNYALTKPINIISHLDSNKINLKYGYALPMIKTFEVYANPHDGQHFKIKIQLRDTASFSVYKIDPGTGYISAEMHFNNLLSHEFTGFTSSQSEVYYLKLIVGKESKVIKVVAVQ